MLARIPAWSGDPSGDIGKEVHIVEAGGAAGSSRRRAASRRQRIPHAPNGPRPARYARSARSSAAGRRRGRGTASSTVRVGIDLDRHQRMAGQCDGFARSDLSVAPVVREDRRDPASINGNTVLRERAGRSTGRPVGMDKRVCLHDSLPLLVARAVKWRSCLYPVERCATDAPSDLTP